MLPSIMSILDNSTPHVLYPVQTFNTRAGSRMPCGVAERKDVEIHAGDRNLCPVTDLLLMFAFSNSTQQSSNVYY